MSERPFEVAELDHLVLRVRDLEASLWFYRDVLGCPVERTVEDIGLYQLRAGRHLIDLVPVGSRLGGNQHPETGRRNQDHFCINVTPFDEDALIRFFDDHHVDHGEIGQRYGARGQGPSLYVQDPDGNTVEIKGI